MFALQQPCDHPACVRFFTVKGSHGSDSSLVPIALVAETRTAYVNPEGTRSNWICETASGVVRFSMSSNSSLSGDLRLITTLQNLTGGRRVVKSSLDHRGEGAVSAQDGEQLGEEGCRGAHQSINTEPDFVIPLKIGASGLGGAEGVPSTRKATRRG